MSPAGARRGGRSGSELRAAADAAFEGHRDAGAVIYPRDVFISYAGPDRSTHARPLADALRERGVSVWLDEGVLSDGDSLAKGIGWGLDRASCVVFIITPAFLGRNWPEKELHTALSLEVTAGATRAIALLDAPAEEVFRRYPLLADKLYVSWDSGPVHIADRLSARFARQVANWHIARHPAEYQGPVWTRIVPSAGNESAAHEVTLLWADYRFSTTVQAFGDGPVSLVHHKIEQDSPPLYAYVAPAAVVTVGQGPPPDPDQQNIDEGWVRIAGASVMEPRHD